MRTKQIIQIIGVIGSIVAILTYLYEIYPWPFVLNPDFVKKIDDRTTWTQHGSIDPGTYKGKQKKGGNYKGSLATIVKIDSGIVYFSNNGGSRYFFNETVKLNTFKNDSLGELIEFVSVKKAFQKYCSDSSLKCGDRGTLTLKKVD
ncbi:hypothetical protein [Aquimarina sediminis]|uniref:hypothetical protein n=1 Tax=Aquimarina sediminis TaxID=2070536 RepID=UPI000FFEC126|nr:hypothetical protein [Aquimarina sediminis]